MHLVERHHPARRSWSRSEGWAPLIRGKRRRLTGHFEGKLGGEASIQGDRLGLLVSPSCPFRLPDMVTPSAPGCAGPTGAAFEDGQAQPYRQVAAIAVKEAGASSTAALPFST